MYLHHLIIASIFAVFFYYHMVRPLVDIGKELLTDAKKAIRNVLIDAICSKYALVPFYTLDEINEARNVLAAQSFRQLIRLYRALK
jgi:hypothetical protein